MAEVQALSRLPSVDRRRPLDTRNDREQDASPNGEALILANRNTTSQEEALQRIASLPPLRQGKVLDIRRQIAQGTYEVANRLDKAMDRVLEALTS
jgi:anti-sigma28 factor (negative regulator of flagellin synthesis)